MYYVVSLNNTLIRITPPNRTCPFSNSSLHTYSDFPPISPSATCIAIGLIYNNKNLFSAMPPLTHHVQEGIRPPPPWGSTSMTDDDCGKRKGSTLTPPVPQKQTRLTTFWKHKVTA